ncbi:hypothetical protein [Flammeovirga pacifica]|uniref:Uncharacterized protein n=1 Tax=Flammeovirga pacifica TaxID=915059 RepID=A0A1S1Z1G4_FLAPC|nr:hypothetical protein [Flammeovirga pacifica]OHX67023.1 hypothetical protein NH26_12045 [Flammeovirga pacifica]
MENSNKENTNQPSPNKNNDEIDLIELFSLIVNKINTLFTNIISFFIAIIVYLYKKIYAWKVAILIGVVVGGIVGFLMKNTSQYYASKATVNSPYLKGVDFKTEIEELNSLCNDDGREKLSKQLNLPIEVVSQLSEINVSGYFEKYLLNKISEENVDSLLIDALQNEARFELYVSTNRNKLSKVELQNGFEYFFKNNVFINKYKKVYQQGLLDKEKTLVSQRIDLKGFNDAYKNVILSQSLGSSANKDNVINLKMSDDDGLIKQSGDKSLEVMEEDRRLSDQLMHVRKQLSVEGNVEFINRFSELNTVSLSTKGKVAFGMLFGFISILIFSILVDVNKFLKKKSGL